MQRTIRWLALGAAVFLMAACSHHPNPNAPLAYVPANTPYLVANLKPISAQARAGLMPASASSAAWNAELGQVKQAADALGAKGHPQLANLLRAVLQTANGTSYTQMPAKIGIDPNGLFAIYGVGLSPVARGTLSDPAKFHAYVNKLATAYGKPFVAASLDHRDYQHLLLGNTGTQLLVASHAKQFVVALLPTAASTQQLRLVLGLDHPKQSIQSSGRLAKLARREGYGPYWLGYVDTTKLPALIAAAHDPLLQALANAVDGKHSQQAIAKVLPASCAAGLARITARVPRISFGFTQLDAKTRNEQIDIQLAPDIVKAFRGVGTAVPGLGQSGSAPLDLAMVLPVSTFRDFWLAQAEAVAAKPFTCPGLKPLNKVFASMQKGLPKLGIPPFGDLRGFRLVLDHIDLSNLGQSNPHQLPKLDARLLIASHNPAGLLNLAKTLVPGMASLAVGHDGKPVQLPAAATANLGQPMWVAMNKQALAIGIGQNEGAKLTPMLNAGAGQADTLAHSHMTGQFEVQVLNGVSQALARAQAKLAVSHNPAAKDLTTIQARLASAREQMKHLKDTTSAAHLTHSGIRITVDTRWQ